MAMLWSLLNYIYPGPQTMLFVHLSLLWLSVGFLYFADKTNKYRWIYFIIPFLPNIFVQSANIWKDIAFGNSFLFVFSVSVYYLYRKNKTSIWMFLISLLVVFYGTSVKFQAQFIVPFIIYFMFLAILKTNYLYNIFGSIILSIILITSNNFIIDKYTVNTESWQLRQLFDISAIIQELDDDTDLPQYVKNYKNYNFQTLKDNFTHKWVDTLIFPEDRVFTTTLDTKELDELNNTFTKLITNHPFLYLKHRIINFFWLMQESVSATAFTQSMNIKEITDVNIHHFENNYLKAFLIKILRIIPKIFTVNMLSVIIIFYYGFYCYKHFTLENNEIKILIFITISSIIFMLVLFFKTMASDYRYYHFIRLFSLFSLPIFLKLWNEYKAIKKSNKDEG